MSSEGQGEGGGSRPVRLGYKLSSEEQGPRELARLARLAEDNGFEFALISDHFHPWIDRQGQSPFVWSRDRSHRGDDPYPRARHRGDLSHHAHASRAGRAGRGDVRSGRGHAVLRARDHVEAGRVSVRERFRARIAEDFLGKTSRRRNRGPVLSVSEPDGHGGFHDLDAPVGLRMLMPEACVDHRHAIHEALMECSRSIIFRSTSDRSKTPSSRPSDVVTRT